MKILNRALALDNSGGYIVSQSIKFEKNKMYLYSIAFKQWVECDESTRSINFNDMICSNGGIFASLREDGKGGDILHWHNQTDEPDCDDSVVFYNGITFMCMSEELSDLDIESMVVVGIQK
jgi:hypothetical protein